MRPVLRAALALLATLGKNAVPLGGVVAMGWPASNAMALYIGETFVLLLLTALTVRIAAPEEEGAGGELKTRRSILNTFLLITIPPAFGAALFSAFIIYVRPELEILPRELLAAFAAMLVFQIVGFVSDLGRVRGISLPACEEVLAGVAGRVWFLAMAVWAGMLAAMIVPGAFILPFMILKTITDLWRIRPEALKRRVMMSV